MTGVTLDCGPERAAERVRSFLRAHLEETDATGYVLGLSGGLDSTVAAHLAVDAVGADRVTGLILPGEPSAERHMDDARELAADLGVTRREFDIVPVVEALRDAPTYDVDTKSLGNVRARVRMVFEYQEANVHDGLVLGPDNRSELALGYFTKYGDGGVDVSPLGDLYKTELYALGRHLGVSERIVEKTPTAELWEGQTDEDELGASYDAVDAVLRHLLDEGRSVGETAARTDVDRETVERFARMHRESRHKRSPPPTPGLRPRPTPE